MNNFLFVPSIQNASHDHDSPFRGKSSTVPDALAPVPVSFNRAKWRIPTKISRKAHFSSKSK